jgi:predicted Zn-dependent protease
LAPQHALLKVNLARSLLGTKSDDDVKEAEGLLVDAISLEPDNSFAWNQLAVAYARQGRIGDADLATAEEAYNVGNMSRANVFAQRALKNLKMDTPNGQRADDILAMSDARNRNGRGGRPGLALHTQH